MTPQLSARSRVFRWALVGAEAVVVLFFAPTWQTFLIFFALACGWIGGTFFGFVADEYWPTRPRHREPREWHGHMTAGHGGRIVDDGRRWR